MSGFVAGCLGQFTTNVQCPMVNDHWLLDIDNWTLITALGARAARALEPPCNRINRRVKSLVSIDPRLIE